ncbi:MAG: hypothetical protein ABS76_29995 [Pelagibacterium sp. SCN 64-44]|nr:MAG: hypothetical protein ABS76_29995 [Pelagibacterium sp. SCN 64-44]
MFDFTRAGRGLAFILLCLCVLHPITARAQGLTAFERFVAEGKYEDANFYLANGYVTAANLDTSQLFYTVLMQRYFSDLQRNGRAVERLYNYLGALAPIDLNRRFACDGGECLLVNHLMYGTRPVEIAWFVARGLDLNKREPDIIPANVPLMLRFGTAYSLADINWLSTNGMVMGDEAYSIDELVTYRDSWLQDYSGELTLPTNYLNLGNQNFLDLLVVALASRTENSNRLEARRRDAMCSFIAYAASAYTPSFDYLDHVLTAIPEFRGGMIGQQDRDSQGVYQPFPSACVSLVQAMANSHARLNEVMDRFANAGDVGTASWLLSLMQARNQ